MDRTSPILCENYFEELSKTNLDSLNQLIIKGMSNGHLTIALPYLAVGAKVFYLQTIALHLYHDSPVVREGAIIALWEYGKHYKNWVKFYYDEVVKYDDNETLRQMAKEYCEELVNNYDIWFDEK